MSEQVIERVAVLLCEKEGVQSVKAALTKQAELNVHSPARFLLGGGDPETECQFGDGDVLILYTVAGVKEHDDSKVFVLDSVTRAEHDRMCTLRREIKYACVLKAFLSYDAVSSTDSKTDNKTGNSEEENEGVAARTEWKDVQVIRLDCPGAPPQVAAKAAMSLIIRQSQQLARAEQIEELMEKGVGHADSETALTDCCTWLFETLSQIEDEFTAAVRTLASSGPRTTVPHGISLVDAVLKRATAVELVHDYVNNPENVFLKIAPHVETLSPAGQRWSQRLAHLELLRERYRSQGVWCSLLASPLMTLKLTNTYRSQSVDVILEALPRLVSALLLLFAGLPDTYEYSTVKIQKGRKVGGNQAEATGEFLSFLNHVLVPVISQELVSKAAELLSLQTGALFSVQSVADASELKGYIMPLCTRESAQFLFTNSAKMLRYWGLLFERVSSFFLGSEQNIFADRTNAFTTRKNKGAKSADETEMQKSTSEVVLSRCLAPAYYAADRCIDLLGLIAAVDKAGHGMITPEVRCLFNTMVKASTEFNFLDSTQHKNWIKFRDIFQKTMDLKYVDVEGVVYETNTEGPFYLDALEQFRLGLSFQTTKGNVANTTLDVNSVNVSVISRSELNSQQQGQDASQSMDRVGRTVDEDGSLQDAHTVPILLEERAVLSSRVAILTEELRECRALIAHMQDHVQKTEEALQTAQELNLTLLAEMKDLQHEQLSKRMAETAVDKEEQENQQSP